MSACLWAVGQGAPVDVVAQSQVGPTGVDLDTRAVLSWADGTEAEVREYCELSYGLDLPMTTISHVRGEDALPLYRWLAEAGGFEPGWNFNKVLLGADGAILGTWGSRPSPLGAEITGAVEAALGS